MHVALTISPKELYNILTYIFSVNFYLESHVAKNPHRQDIEDQSYL